MKIRVVPRSFFEEIAGTKTERFLLEEWKVISILSHNGYDSEPPFSEAMRQSPNLLVLRTMRQVLSENENTVAERR